MQTSIAFTEEIKIELKQLLSNSVYAKTNTLEQRIEQLFLIHQNWLEVAKKTYNSIEIAKRLSEYEKNLK